jgi:hypothetical protein
MTPRRTLLEVHSVEHDIQPALLPQHVVAVDRHQAVERMLFDRSPFRVSAKMSGARHRSAHITLHHTTRHNTITTECAAHRSAHITHHHTTPHVTSFSAHYAPSHHDTTRYELSVQHIVQRTLRSTTPHNTARHKTKHSNTLHSHCYTPHKALNYTPLQTLHDKIEDKKTKMGRKRTEERDGWMNRQIDPEDRWRMDKPIEVRQFGGDEKLSGS